MECGSLLSKAAQRPPLSPINQASQNASMYTAHGPFGINAQASITDRLLAGATVSAIRRVKERTLVRRNMRFAASNDRLLP